VCIALVNDSLLRISVKSRTQMPSDDDIDWSGSAAGDVVGVGVHECRREGEFVIQRRCSLCPLAAMSSARCGLGTAVLHGQLVAVGKC